MKVLHLDVAPRAREPVSLAQHGPETQPFQVPHCHRCSSSARVGSCMRNGEHLEYVQTAYQQRIKMQRVRGNSATATRASCARIQSHGVRFWKCYPRARTVHCQRCLNSTFSEQLLPSCMQLPACLFGTPASARHRIIYLGGTSSKFSGGVAQERLPPEVYAAARFVTVPL